MLFSAPFTRLLAAAFTLAPLAAAYPGRLPPAAAFQRSGNDTLLARELPQKCNSNSDCPYQTPLCEFPFLFEPAPYNSPQRVCMRAPYGNPCSIDAGCGSNFCLGSTCSVNYMDNVNSMSCLYDVDCGNRGRCGTAADVQADGTSLQGKCLITGGSPCSESAQCQSGTCGFVCGGDPFGLPSSNPYACGYNLYQDQYPYAASTELADGTFAISPKVYDLRICGYNDIGFTCLKDSECSSGNCLDMFGDGLRCGFGQAVGTACARNVECHTGRCAGTAGSPSPVCTYQPVGGPCYFPSACGTGVCSNSKCKASDAGGKCFYASDCASMNCNEGICGPSLSTITATSSTDSSSPTSAASTSMTDSTASTATASITSTTTPDSTTSTIITDSTSTTSTTTALMTTTTSSDLPTSTTTSSTPTSSHGFLDVDVDFHHEQADDDYLIDRFHDKQAEQHLYVYVFIYLYDEQGEQHVHLDIHVYNDQGKQHFHIDLDLDQSQQHTHSDVDVDVYDEAYKHLDVDFEQGIYLLIFLLDHIVQVDCQHNRGHDYQDDDDDDFFGNEYEQQQEHHLLFLSHQQVELYHEQARLYRFFDDDEADQHEPHHEQACDDLDADLNKGYDDDDQPEHVYHDF
ncbi:hypothetical protein OC834_003748 [Tilletia horrida]|nr:hypothetical protein OC834_003748 [Tilletia horrida]